MPGPQLTTDAIVLLRRPPTESFQPLSVFSAEHGALRVLHRVPKKPSPAHLALDLFDEVSLLLENPGEGASWFVKEARLLRRHEGVGRDYEALVRASALTALVDRNPVPGESRAPVYSLLQHALAAFARGAPPGIVHFKALYCFARDEGYPLKQDWLPSLPAADRDLAADLLRSPADDHPAPPAGVDRLARGLEAYLRARTDILLD